MNRITTATIAARMIATKAWAAASGFRRDHRPVWLNANVAAPTTSMSQRMVRKLNWRGMGLAVEASNQLEQDEDHGRQSDGDGQEGKAARPRGEYSNGRRKRRQRRLDQAAIPPNLGFAFWVSD